MNKKELVEKINSLDALTTEEKSALIDLLKLKKYGLVWENKPEDVEERLRAELPVLKEVTDKAILDGGEETPNHILIEGDNLEALTALTYTHENNVDIIYIDPPYNTGNKDFVYNDSFVDSEDGYRHSKWLSFMDKRLRIAKKLLSEYGVIFISIDDNEQARLKLLCDDIFQPNNMIACFCWKTDGNFDNQAKVKICHEYILMYAKNADKFSAPPVVDPNIPEGSKIFKSFIRNTVVKNGPKNPIGDIVIPAGFPCDIENGKIEVSSVVWPKYSGDIIIKDHKTVNEVVATSGWASAGQLRDFIKNKFVKVTDTKGQLTGFVISQSGAIETIKDRGIPSHVVSYLQNFGGPQKATTDLLGLGDKFSYPKPVQLIKYLISFKSKDQCVTVLDFFAGSGTTLHATMLLNAEDGGSRKCILVTNNENNICEEVTYERNKRVINGYTTPKGEEVEGLKANNLRYYQIDHVERESSLTAKRKLMAASAELLCIKHDIYEESTTFGTLKLKPHIARYFTDGKKQMLVIYMVEAIERIVEEIQTMPEDTNIMVYVFSTNNYAMDADFEDVADKVKLCALPAAIYNAYLKVLPKKGEPKQIIEEEF